MASHTNITPPDIWRMTTKDDSVKSEVVSPISFPPGPSLNEIVDLDNRLKTYDDRMARLEENADDTEKSTFHQIEDIYSQLAELKSGQEYAEEISAKMDRLIAVISEKSFDVSVNPKIEIPKIDLPQIAGIKMQVPYSIIGVLYAIFAALAWFHLKH